MTKQELLIRLADFCHEKKIRLAYARPYRNLDDMQYDADILIEHANLKIVLKWLLQQNDLCVSSYYKRHDGYTVHFVGIGNNKGAFSMDFISELSLKNLPYLSINTVMSRATKGTILILDNLDQAIILIMTRIIKHADHLKAYHYDFVNQILQTSETAFLDFFQEKLGNSCVALVDDIRAKQFSVLHAKKYRRAYILRSLKHNPFSVFKLLWYGIKDICCRITAPKFWIVVYGLDGAGKTTLINTIIPAMHGMTKTIRHCHFRAVLPGGAVPDSSKVNSFPHAKRPRGYFLSTAKIVYYFLHYWLCYTWPMRGSTLFIFDRYMPDMLVDPKRLRYGGSKFLLKFLCKKLPPIKASIWLDTSAETAHQRKPEVSIDEAKRQHIAYNELVKQLPNVLVLRGDLPLTLNAVAAIDHIKQTLCETKK